MKPKQQNNIQSFNQHISGDQILEIRILDQRSDLIYLWLSFLLLILLVELGVEDLHPVPPHPLQPPDVSPDRRTGVQHLHGASLYCDTSLLELSRRLHEVLRFTMLHYWLPGRGCRCSCRCPPPAPPSELGHCCLQFHSGANTFKDVKYLSK